MPAAPLLSPDEIQAALTELAEWRLDDGRLVRTFHFADFTAALQFVNRVAVPAEEQDHHPDVAIHWNEVRLSLWTHAAGGVTGRDVRLARAIDLLAGSR